MSSRVWNNGPPPHIGWWNASTHQSNDAWRWWDGRHWSAVARPSFSRKQIHAATSIVAAPWLGSNSGIQWTDYWPENARVPRIAP